MAVRKNTSDRLEKVRCSAEKVNTTDQGTVEERCPWYVALTRLLVVLAIVGVMFMFFCTFLRAGLLLVDKSIVVWLESLQQTHPAIFYGVLLAGYVIFLVAFVNNFADCAINAMAAPSPSIEEEKEKK